jgi:hypothetical protein
MLEEDVRKGKFQPLPEEGALKYGHVTPEYDITELVDKDMPRLRKVCIDLRRAELTAAKEHDRVRAAAQGAARAQAQPTLHSDGRRTSGADQLRHKSIEVRAGGRVEPESDEMDESEAMVEDDERQADAAFRTGLEAAIQVQENAVDSTLFYSEGEGTEAEEIAKEEAAAAAGIAIREQAATTSKAEKRGLLETHRDARKAVDEWRESLGHAKEATHQGYSGSTDRCTQSEERRGSTRRGPPQRHSKKRLDATPIRRHDCPRRRPRRQANGPGGRR